MSPAKKPVPTRTPNAPGGLSKALAFAFGPGRPATLCILVLIAFVIAASALWSYVRMYVNQSPQYTVTLDQISVTPAPPWVPAARAKSIPAEALRLASPADHPLSSLDNDLNERIYKAFTLNPWIVMAKVAKRAPARIVVDLVYRRPVCMVDVGNDLLPVDVEGVLLPSEDFSPLEKQSLPCLSGIDTRPLGPAGQHWGDPHVIEGAAIADVLTPQWRILKLQSVRPSAGNHYKLVTNAKSHILWGLPPGQLSPTEPTAEDKLARLVRYANEHGGLDGPNGPQEFDVRSLPRADAPK